MRASSSSSTAIAERRNTVKGPIPILTPCLRERTDVTARASRLSRRLLRDQSCLAETRGCGGDGAPELLVARQSERGAHALDQRVRVGGAGQEGLEYLGRQRLEIMGLVREIVIDDGLAVPATPIELAVARKVPSHLEF